MDTPRYQPSERRPIASRDTRLMHAIARRLVRWNVSPNLISLMGIVASLLAGLAFWSTSVASASTTTHLAWLAGAALVQMRLLANLFDGMVAIASGKASPVGELYNEVPDRVSDSVTLIGLGYAVGGNPALGFLAALAAVFTAYVRASAKIVGGNQDYCGPMAKPQRMFLVTVCAVYMGLTPDTWHVAWRSWGLPSICLVLIFVGSLLTSIRRLLRVSRQLRG